jgi:hypothetical protein
MRRQVAQHFERLRPQVNIAVTRAEASACEIKLKAVEP